MTAPVAPQAAEPKGALKLVSLPRLAIPAAVGLAIWMLPHPAEITGQAWQMLAIFIATIVAIIAKPMPMGAVTVLGMVVCILTGTVPLTAAKPGDPTALMGFGNGTIWLIVRWRSSSRPGSSRPVSDAASPCSSSRRSGIRCSGSATAWRWPIWC